MAYLFKPSDERSSNTVLYTGRMMQTNLLASLAIKTLPNNCLPPHSNSRGLLYGEIIHDQLQESDAHVLADRTGSRACGRFTGNQISRVRTAKYLVEYRSGYISQIHRCTQRYTKRLLASLWCLFHSTSWTMGSRYSSASLPPS